MLVAEAHSFQQQARLAITLAWVAGYTNIQTIIICGATTSHVSGTASNLGRAVAEGSDGPALRAFLLMFSFFLGSALSGACSELGKRRGWESIYVLPIAIEAAVLAFLAVGLEVWALGLEQSAPFVFAMAMLAAWAMGLQNATITRISSGVVRTTHVTGVLTDLGLESVQFLGWLWDKRRARASATLGGALASARAHPSARRLALLASILGSFCFGAGLGALAHEGIRGWSMFPPVAFLVWIVWQDIARPIAEIEPHRPRNGAELPESLAVYRLKQGGDAAKKHRMPNLSAWSERLPPSVKAVALDLTEATWIDANAYLELRSASRRMKREGRFLALGGLEPAQRERLRAAWSEDSVPEIACGSIGTAIALALRSLDVQAAADFKKGLAEIAAAKSKKKQAKKNARSREKKRRSRRR